MKKRTRTWAAVLIVIAASVLPGPSARILASEMQSVPIPFYHESSDEPRLEQLLKEFDFTAQVSAGVTEFQEMALLKNWIYTSIPYDLNYNDSELRDSITILRRAARKQAFICTTLSTAFVQTAVSMGWTSRQVILKKRAGDEHAANDIWSNQYRKWVYIDPTWNIHIERHRVPLSISEIRREWLKNGGREIVYVFGAGKNEKRYRTRDLPVKRQDSRIWGYIPLDHSWLAYFNEVAILGRNDFFSCCNPNGANAWDPMYVMVTKRSWKDRFKSFFTKSTGYSSKALFYDLNRVDVRIDGQPGKRPGARTKSVDVRLDAFGRNNYTPNFMEYLVKLNGDDWKVTGDRFTWKLQPGENVLRARIMNRFGVVGPVTEKRLAIEGTSVRKDGHTGGGQDEKKKRSIKLRVHN